MNPDPLVIFTPSGKRGYFKMGTSLLAAAQQLAVDLDSVCGGRGVCSKCQVTPSYGEFPKHGIFVGDDALSEWNVIEQRYKDKRGMLDGRRLGCQSLVSGDVVVDVPPESQTHKQVVRKRAEARDIEIDPATKLFYVVVSEPDMHDPSGDLERLSEALRDQWQIENIQSDLFLLRILQPALRKGEWKVTCAIRLGTHNQPPRLVHVWPGLYNRELFGIAIDLGSTTIAAHLCNLTTGDILDSSGIMNPQIRFGEDLMSRVSYSMMNEGGDLEMSEAAKEGVNALLSEISEQAKIDPLEVIEVVFVCNPVMHHLYLGIDPFELGQAPFALATSRAVNLLAKDLDLPIHPQAGAYILPSIASHVGADAAAVLLSEAPEKSSELTLVVDVGTNAEIILGNKNKILACSAPTGPAFEGAQVSCGQRAAPGAIERVRINPITKEPRFSVVGSDIWSDEAGFQEVISSTGITGICGSGIIEMVAEMRLAGIVDSGGLIGSPEDVGTERCVKEGRTFTYHVWGDLSKKDDRRITITNQDIREIQMAKAALFSSIRLLMDKFHIDSVDRIVLAGAFGAHISPQHAMLLGMIPNCKLDNIVSAGNAAGTSARIALLNVKSRTEIESSVHTIQKVETAIEPRFQEHFANASSIPNAVERFPVLNRDYSFPDVNFNQRDRSKRAQRT
ncbi:ASKHA domain-containing protein [Kiloniella sp.]|uniref:ASKHA domain-containing protein n=1 Tax=Kiloniella sp. TaxID=1938587 RepID=UPI003B013055